MKRDEALERMDEIQRIVERTALYTLLPGYPAIIGGGLALAGCVFTYGRLGSLDFGDLMRFPFSTQLVLLGMIVYLHDIPRIAALCRDDTDCVAFRKVCD